jgi:hypothetical protein
MIAEEIRDIGRDSLGASVEKPTSGQRIVDDCYGIFDATISQNLDRFIGEQIFRNMKNLALCLIEKRNGIAWRYAHGEGPRHVWQNSSRTMD